MSSAAQEDRRFFRSRATTDSLEFSTGIFRPATRPTESNNPSLASFCPDPGSHATHNQLVGVSLCGATARTESKLLSRRSLGQAHIVYETRKSLGLAPSFRPCDLRSPLSMRRRPQPVASATHIQHVEVNFYCAHAPNAYRSRLSADFLPSHTATDNQNPRAGCFDLGHIPCANRAAPARVRVFRAQERDANQVFSGTVLCVARLATSTNPLAPHNLSRVQLPSAIQKRRDTALLCGQEINVTHQRDATQSLRPLGARSTRPLAAQILPNATRDTEHHLDAALGKQ